MVATKCGSMNRNVILDKGLGLQMLPIANILEFAYNIAAKNRSSKNSLRIADAITSYDFGHMLCQRVVQKLRWWVAIWLLQQVERYIETSTSSQD